MSIRIFPFFARMSISRKLAASTVITVFLALLVSASLYISAREIDKASETDGFADRVVKDVSNLNSLSYAYLLLRSERPKIQWQLKHDSLGKLLSEHRAIVSEEQALLNRMRENHGQMKRLFDAVSREASRSGKVSAQDRFLYDELNEGVTAQLITRAEMMVNDASLLARSAGRRVEDLRRSSLILVFASAFILILSAVSTSFVLAKNIAGSMRGLDKGAQEIASGNLEYRVKVSSEDEIGLVGASFNDMAARLKASYSQLECEVGERRQAEMALAELNKTLEQRVAERTAELTEREGRLRRFYESPMLGVFYWNMDGLITDANDRFLEMIGYTRDDLARGKIDWTGMTPQEYRYLDEQAVIELKKRGVNKAPFEKEFACKDGSRMPILIAGAMIDEARFNGVAFVLDITERKRAEAQVKRYVDELRRANEELTRFNRAMVGRELRMVELKQEINALSVRLGLPQPYKVEDEEEQAEGGKVEG